MSDYAILYFFFFFFQAEDGIRDLTVTGVQTCALPILITRFVPILRTFAPFVAGIARMTYLNFTAYNLAGALAWVLSLLYAGYWFGNVPFVKENLTWVILGIVVRSEEHTSELQSQSNLVCR